MNFKCPTCQRIKEPINAANLPGKLRRHKDFSDCVAVDLFELADVRGNRKTFLNCLDLASRFQLVVPVDSKHPAVVWQRFLESWVSWAGPPHEMLCDMGGEFKREFASEVESMGIQYRTTAAISPTQNAACERAGGAWKLHAKALLDEFSITFVDQSRLWWLTCVVNWAVNSMVDASGFSPSQWVLGRGIKLPYDMLSQSARLSLHTRHATCLLYTSDAADE